MSPAHHASAMRAIKLAQDAIRGRPRQITPEHRAKLRQNAKAASAARTEASFAKESRAKVQHGLMSRRLRDTTVALGEDPRDYDSLMRLVRRYFNPGNEAEEKLVDLLGRSLWRHHRLYFAQGHWEIQRLLGFLQGAAPLESSDPHVLASHAYLLLAQQLKRERFYRYDRRLRGSTERILRRFLRQRTGRPHLEFQTKIGRKRKPDDDWDLRMIRDIERQLLSLDSDFVL